jgi:hypothetical protein
MNLIRTGACSMLRFDEFFLVTLNRRVWSFILGAVFLGQCNFGRESIVICTQAAYRIFMGKLRGKHPLEK